MSAVIARQITERDIEVVGYLAENKNTLIEEIARKYWPEKGPGAAKNRVEALRRAGYVIAVDQETETNNIITIYNISRKGQEMLTDPQKINIPLALREGIERLNKTAQPGRNEIIELRLGGRDFLSDIPLNLLWDHVTEEEVKAVKTAFPDQPKSQAAVLRWIIRGLSPEIAIRKEAISLEFVRSRTPGA